MTPRELIDRIAVGSMRNHAAELEAIIIKGCSRCGAELVRDGKPIDHEGTGVTGRCDLRTMRDVYEVLCRKCSNFDAAVIPESYRSDRHSAVKGKFCPECLRAFAAGFSGRCECGHVFGPPLGIAAEDSKPDGTVELQPVKFTQGGWTRDAYVVPRLTADDLEAAKAALRDNSERMILPAHEPPAWTFFGQPIQQAPMGSVFIVTLPADIEAIKFKMFQTAQQIQVERPDLYFIFLPANVKLEAIAVDDLTKLRDSINAIIYDKERGK